MKEYKVTTHIPSLEYLSKAVEQIIDTYNPKYLRFSDLRKFAGGYMVHLVVEKEE